MGHALGNSLQDLLIRYNRQKGKTTLWLPGCDHAGIATQSVVEKMLWKKKQQTRHDLGREKFIDLVQDWKEEYHDKINNAFRKMGSSLDWSREAFTMVRLVVPLYGTNTDWANRMRPFRPLSPRRGSGSTRRASSTEPTAW
jgi:valyl-tRNA synthetase